MTEPLDAIGLVEVSSIALGHLSEDAMLKAASVDLLMARTICSGKFIVVVGGDVAAVASAVDAGAAVATGGGRKRKSGAQKKQMRVLKAQLKQSQGGGGGRKRRRGGAGGGVAGGGGGGGGKGGGGGGGGAKPKAKGKGLGKAPDGRQCCYSWGRGRDGACKDKDVKDKTCPDSRAHICEFCFSDTHFSRDCSAKPSWATF